MKIRNAVIAGVLVVGSSATTMAVAQATTPTNISTSTNTLISAKCYHHHGHSVNNFRWVKADKRYELYSSPHTSSSDNITCHK